MLKPLCLGLSAIVLGAMPAIAQLPPGYEVVRVGSSDLNVQSGVKGEIAGFNCQIRYFVGGGGTVGYDTSNSTGKVFGNSGKQALSCEFTNTGVQVAQETTITGKQCTLFNGQSSTNSVLVLRPDGTGSLTCTITK